MAWGESKTWLQGQARTKASTRQLLTDAEGAPSRNARRRKKVVTPEEMPWEMSRQGILKHLLNQAMNVRYETLDAYMQIIPPGSRSGKHRHLAEECLYVLEGRGYDLHQDCDVEITDRLRPGRRARRGQALRVGGGRHDLRPAQHRAPAFQCRPEAARCG